MRLGLISDTHGFLDPKVARIFDGVEHILHAGDIGSGHILVELERIAPVTAVLGNNDFDFVGVRESELIELGGRKFFVHHIVAPRHLEPTLGERLSRLTPDFVVFGHTHQAFNEQIDGRWFINPGYAGKPRFRLERSVALLELGRPTPELRFVPLDS